MDESTGPLAAGHVAVVTGAASGIGLALCERLAGEGMRIVMADVEEPALREAAGRLAAVGVWVLCPGWVRTRIHESERNRPHPAGPPDARGQLMRDLGRELVRAGMDPAAVADEVVAGVRARRFYILTHPEMAHSVTKRA